VRTSVSYETGCAQKRIQAHPDSYRIHVSAHDVDVRAKRPQVVLHVDGDEIAGAQDVLNLSGYEQRPEARGKLR
jgi:hypothetical protein